MVSDGQRSKANQWVDIGHAIDGTCEEMRGQEKNQRWKGRVGQSEYGSRRGSYDHHAS